MIDFGSMEKPVVRLFPVVIRLCLLSVLLAACTSSQIQETNPASSLFPTDTQDLTKSSSPTLTFTPIPITAKPTNSETATEVPQSTLTNPPPTSQVGIIQLPDPATYQWRLVIDGLSSPVGLENAGDGSGRLFVVEQPGSIRIIRAGELLPEVFLDISERVS